MKHNFVLSVILILCSFLVYGQAKDDKAIKSFLTRIAEANKKGDFQKFETLYANDFIFIDPEGKKFNKRERIAYLKSIPKPETFSFDNEHIRFYGNIALVNAEVNIKASGQNAYTHMVTIVLLKSNGQWQEVNGQATTKK
ncbi:MAG: hypothetical protein NVSMB67_24330 [Flavisolibacter sp.]